MRKILLVGDYKDNGGPTNVNRKFLEYSNNEIMCIKSDNKYLKFIETLIKIILSKVVVISGFTSKSYIYTKFSHFFKKKVIYIMHGCVKYENEVNNLDLEDKYVNSELVFLNSVDLILCVSEIYSKWVKEYYKDLRTCIGFLNNGIPDFDISNLTNIKKNNNEVKKIILIGGNRNIKNNLIVCNAIDQLIEEGIKLEVKLFGRNYDNNEIIDSKNIEYKGMVPQDILYQYLRDADVYINNSYVESFGLSIFDALICGTSILIGKNVGAASIFDIDDSYVINDVCDIHEIKEKILYVLDNPNNEMIIKTVNKNCDYVSVVNKLINICKEIV